MLVLSRKRDEVIVLSDPRGKEIARIEVVRIDREKVRLGFHAGKDVKILRQELISGESENV